MHVTLKEDVNEAKIAELEERANTIDEINNEYHPKKDLLLSELANARILLNDKNIGGIVNANPNVTLEGTSKLGFAGGLSGLQPLGYVAKSGDTVNVYVGQKGKQIGATVPVRLVFTSSSSAIFASLTSSLSVTCISSAYNPYTSSSKLSYSKKLISEIEFPFSVQAKPYFINVKRTLVASTASGKINLFFSSVGSTFGVDVTFENSHKVKEIIMSNRLEDQYRDSANWDYSGMSVTLYNGEERVKTYSLSNVTQQSLHPTAKNTIKFILPEAVEATRVRFTLIKYGSFT